MQGRGRGGAAEQCRKGRGEAGGEPKEGQGVFIAKSLPSQAAHGGRTGDGACLGTCRGLYRLNAAATPPRDRRGAAARRAPPAAWRAGSDRRQ